MDEQAIQAALVEAERGDITKWGTTLDTVWADIERNGTLTAIEKAELLHKFIASFEKLSKARRSLNGLDAPVRSESRVTVEQMEPQSVDAEVAALAAKLRLFDPEPKDTPTPEAAKPAESI